MNRRLFLTRGGLVSAAVPLLAVARSVAPVAPATTKTREGQIIIGPNGVVHNCEIRDCTIVMSGDNSSLTHSIIRRDPI